MRLRRRSPLILLLLPALAASLAVDTKGKAGSVEQLADSPDSRQIDSIIPTKPDKGTKDAPVDGLDGKPHAGPFVYDTKDRKKLEPKVEDLASSKFSDEIYKARDEGWEIPDRVDSVMTDREGERKGKSSVDGTEGGVSEKDRKKAESGSDKEEKRPAGPKEVLDHHEHEKEKVVKGSAKDSTTPKSSTKDDKKEKNEKGIGGLEVR
jgi:hypothetical protein